MKLYIAARYDRLDEMNNYAAVLRQNGIEITSRWLDGTHQLHPSPEKVDAATENVAWEARPFAQDDFEDVAKSDVLLFFSEPANSHSKRGGRHVEFGLALAWNKRIIAVGCRENVFHCLPRIEHCDSFSDAFIRIFGHI